MEEWIREELHKLLDKMIDEDKEIGIVQNAVAQDGIIEITQYRLNFQKRKENLF